MLKKIKQEIVVIIISISSMLITAFATIYGVQITNEHNLKMQDRQFKIENVRKEIEKREEISKRITQVYSNNDSYEEKKELIKDLRQVGNDLLSITVDKEINEKFKEFMRDSVSSIEGEYDKSKLNNSYSSLMSLIKSEEIKYQASINFSNSL